MWYDAELLAIVYKIRHGSTPYGDDHLGDQECVDMLRAELGGGKVTNHQAIKSPDTDAQGPPVAPILREGASTRSKEEISEAVRKVKASYGPCCIPGCGNGAAFGKGSVCRGHYFPDITVKDGW